MTAGDLDSLVRSSPGNAYNQQVSSNERKTRRDSHYDGELSDLVREESQKKLTSANDSNEYVRAGINNATHLATAREDRFNTVSTPPAGSLTYDM